VIDGANNGLPWKGDWAMKIERTIRVLAMAAVLLLSAGGVLAAVEDYLPSVQISGVPISDVATLLPPTITLNYEGVDPDGEGELPAKVRFLIVPAVAFDGTVVNTRFRYLNYYWDLIRFEDSDWSEWMPYPEDPDQRRITFPDLPNLETFLVAFQVMDRDGAVSLDRQWGLDVINFQIRTNLSPEVVLNEYYLGTTFADTHTEIASGQPLNFSWIASADAYGGNIASYRHGFDLVDPYDPNDPGWSVPPGTLPTNLFAEERIFQEGYHRFTLRVIDDSGQVTLLTWDLEVIPYIDLPFQYPLMLIDQVVDSQTNQWPGQGGSPAYDKEQYRNAFYRFLEGAGGVAGFNWDQDRRDHTEQVVYRDLVWYRAVMCYARSHSYQLMFSEFRPVDGEDRFVWLAPYQYRGGNLFLVGAQSMESFLEQGPNYMVPIIFDTTEEFYYLAGETYVVGFGESELPDGTLVLRGPRQYPFATAGIAALDWSVPLNKYIYGRRWLANLDRRSACAGIKAVALDPEFKANHLISADAIADTIATNELIDWYDGANPGGYLDVPFPFAGDEFVDANISTRPTPWTPQECPDGPDGMCIEPMFTGMARFDWLREQHWAAGDPGWPQSTYTPTELDEICGPLALGDLDEVPDRTALSSGKVYGYLSYKNVEEKPSGRADAYWGFDPYRFDHVESQKAMRWVLEYFGLELNR
jgi:hypothetical protein